MNEEQLNDKRRIEADKRLESDIYKLNKLIKSKSGKDALEVIKRRFGIKKGRNIFNCQAKTDEEFKAKTYARVGQRDLIDIIENPEILRQ